MATTSDLRKGMLIRYNGAVHRVIEYQHIAPGNWRAMVRMKLKNFETGKIIEDRVRAGSEIDVVTTQTREAQYLYDDGTAYHFMDNETFDQIALPKEDFEDTMIWMKENDMVTLLLQDDGRVLSVEIPTFVTLRVTEADVAVRGDTSGRVMKRAKVETGAELQVPDFVKEGDLIKIDTRTGEYVERVS
ncbi:MAG: elongation factor P [Caldilinea sp.]|nr:elongation factor P [Caldilinea sp.]MDW8438876.1 elongation factor P [Caldilineaceae bacterium]